MALAIAVAGTIAALFVIQRSWPRLEQHDRHIQSTPMTVAEIMSRLPSAESFALGNGLQVVVVTDRASRDIAHMVWYKVGFADDPPQKPGLAHFVEHLTFGGTKTYSGRAFSSALDRAASKQDAITARDHTVYYQLTSLKNLPAVMQVEAERMSSVIITSGSMALEAKAVEDEQKQIDDDPYVLLEERMRRALYGNHPYGASPSAPGGMRERVSQDDATAFYRLWYAPNNAFILVHGNVTAAQVRPLAERHYGGIPSARNLLARRARTDVAAGSGTHLAVRDERVHTPIWKRGYLVPCHAGSAGQSHPLQLLSELLSAALSDRLRQDPASGRTMAREVRVDYEPDSVGPETFTIEIVVGSDADVDNVARTVNEALNALMANLASENDLARARASLRARPIFSEEGIPSVTQFMGNALAAGRTLEDLKAWPQRIDAVTAEQVREAARMLFLPDCSVTGIALAPAGVR